jgi:Kef-type K+ transport system membrane component KefB
MTSLFATEIQPDAARSLARLDAETLLLPILVQLVVIIAAARAFGALARRVGQPSVVGEIVAGLVLGPSLLGWLAPDLFAAVFHPRLEGVGRSLSDALVEKVMTVVAQVGLIFLMFLVGLEFEGGHVRSSGRAVLLISLAGVAVPFGLGAALGPAIHPHLEPHPTAGVASVTGV